MSQTTTTEDVTGKLHRASCIVAHVANAALEVRPTTRWQGKP